MQLVVARRPSGVSSVSYKELFSQIIILIFHLCNLHLTVSPLIFAACAMVEGVNVYAEFSVNGLQARGRIDWVLLFRHLSIVIIEVKPDYSPLK